MDSIEFLAAQIEEHAAVLGLTHEKVAAPFAKIVDACAASLKAGGKILFLGNGGSAADAQHLAAELVVRYRTDRKALAALALTTDTSTLTACANDISFDQVYSRQVESLAKPGDVVIGISTSGRSVNVIKALEAARGIGAFSVGFTGNDGGDMVRLCDAVIVVPSRTTARIQEMHLLIGHALCDVLERTCT